MSGRDAPRGLCYNDQAALGNWIYDLYYIPTRTEEGVRPFFIDAAGSTAYRDTDLPQFYYRQTHVADGISRLENVETIRAGGPLWGSD